MKNLIQVLLLLASMGALLMVDGQLSSKPTRRPTTAPTCAPATAKPTRSPTAKPSRKPTWTKTSKPTKRKKKKKAVKRPKKCKKSSKKSSKRPSIKKTKSPAYSGISFQAASVMNTVACIDGNLTYPDNWGSSATVLGWMHHGS